LVCWSFHWKIKSGSGISWMQYEICYCFFLKLCLSECLKLLYRNAQIYPLSYRNYLLISSLFIQYANCYRLQNTQISSVFGQDALMPVTLFSFWTIPIIWLSFYLPSKSGLKMSLSQVANLRSLTNYLSSIFFSIRFLDGCKQFSHGQHCQYPLPAHISFQTLKNPPCFGNFLNSIVCPFITLVSFSSIWFFVSVQVISALSCPINTMRFFSTIFWYARFGLFLVWLILYVFLSTKMKC